MREDNPEIVLEITDCQATVMAELESMKRGN
jgi:hypothetical protein